MESSNYYQHNLETDKLNIHTTKAFYDGLQNEHRNVFKKYCLWSRGQNCWISKAKANNTSHLITQLKQMGFVPADPIGEKLPFVQQVEREQQRASNRVERFEHKADKASTESDRLYERAKDMASAIPFGQPILVGHHSEKRDRNYRAKIHDTFGKAFAEADKAEHYKDRADSARYDADGSKYSNPKYLSNRIKETDKVLRLLHLRLEGKLYKNSPPREISEEARISFSKQINEQKEKLEFYEKKMHEINPEWQRKSGHKKEKNNRQTP